LKSKRACCDLYNRKLKSETLLLERASPFNEWFPVIFRLNKSGAGARAGAVALCARLPAPNLCCQSFSLLSGLLSLTVPSFVIQALQELTG
jgi:hypothetical protein